MLLCSNLSRCHLENPLGTETFDEELYIYIPIHLMNPLFPLKIRLYIELKPLLSYIRALFYLPL